MSAHEYTLKLSAEVISIKGAWAEQCATDEDREAYISTMLDVIHVAHSAIESARKGAKFHE